MATPFISRLNPMVRQDGVQTPGALSAATWIDARVLGAGVAETYTLPTDAAGRKGVFLRLTSTTTTPIAYKWDGVASVPAADITDGTSSIVVRLDTQPVLLVAPSTAYTLSLICSVAATISIEVWN